MDSFIQGVITQQAESLKHLLNPESKQWSCTEAFSNEMTQLIQRLITHYIKRAALFGAHRIDTEGDEGKTPAQEGEKEPKVKKRKKRPKMEIRESDFDYAWQTIEQDAIK